jgi:hypothetical protein
MKVGIDEVVVGHGRRGWATKEAKLAVRVEPNPRNPMELLTSPSPNAVAAKEQWKQLFGKQVTCAHSPSVDV